MGDLERTSAHAREALRFFHQVPQNARAPLAGFVEQDLPAIFGVRERFRRKLSVFELELDLNRHLQRSLNRGHGSLVQPADGLQEQTILAIVHVGDHAFPAGGHGLIGVGALTLRFGPEPPLHVEHKTRFRPVPAASPTEVDTPQRRRIAVGE